MPSARGAGDAAPPSSPAPAAPGPSPGPGTAQPSDPPDPVLAAERGHRVALIERGPSLGGQFRLAGLQPSRGQITELLDCRNKSGAKAHLVGGMRKLRRRFQRQADRQSELT